MCTNQIVLHERAGGLPVINATFFFLKAISCQIIRPVSLFYTLRI